MAAEPGFVRVEQNTVLSWLGHGDTVVREGLGRVEVENEHGAGAVKSQDLVALVLQRYKCLEREVKRKKM